MELITFSFSWVLVIQFILAIVLPLLVAIVTKRSTSGRVKGVLLAALTLVGTLLTQVLGALTTGVPLDLFAAILTALVSFGISVGFYFGLWSTKDSSGDSITSNLQENVGPTDGR